MRMITEAQFNALVATLDATKGASAEVLKIALHEQARIEELELRSDAWRESTFLAVKRTEQLEAAIIAALRAPDEATSREILRKARDGE